MTYNNSSDPTTFTPQSFTLNSTAANTRIRFVGTLSVEQFYVDNIDISGTAATTAVTMTDSNGFYTFDGATCVVPSTTYQVVIDVNQAALLGYDLSPQNAAADTVDSDALLVSGNAVINPASSPAIGADTSFDFGFVSMLNLGNYVWYDANGDGTINGSESGYGLPNVTVELRNSGGGFIASTTTGSDGFYHFSGLLQGDYIVAIPATNFNPGQTLGGLNSTSIDGGDPDNNIDSDDNGIGSGTGVDIVSLPVTLALGTEPSTTTGTGDTNNTVDFGFTAQTCTAGGNIIGGTITREFKMNGIADPQLDEVELWEGSNETRTIRYAEPPLGGVQVNVYDDGNVLIDSVFSLPDGNWSIDASAATGTKVRVEFVAPAGFDSGIFGTNNLSDVLVADIGVCNVDHTAGRASDHCEDNPTYAVACFGRNTDPSTEPVVVSMLSTEGIPHISRDPSGGVTWGIPAGTLPDATKTVNGDLGRCGYRVWPRLEFPRPGFLCKRV